MSKGKTTKPKHSARKTSAKNLASKFNAGEDVLDYFDLSSAKHPAKLKKPVRATGAENQIEFRKGTKGGWDVITREPLACRVREHCRRKQITVRQFMEQLVTEAMKRRATPNRSNAKREAAKLRKSKASRSKAKAK